MPKRRGRGTGSVRAFGGGRWRASYSIDGNRGSKVCDSKAEAESWLRQQLSTGPASPDTLGAWLTKWLTLIRPEVAPTTYYHDEFRVRRWLIPILGPIKLRDLSGLKVREFLRDLASEASDTERHKAGSVLRKALNAAVRAGLIQVSPMAGVKLPAEKREPKRPFTAAELSAFLAVADETKRGYAFRLWADAGLRPGEMFALDWSDFPADCSTVSVTKSLDSITHRLRVPKTKGSRRTLPLAPSTSAALRSARPTTGGVFLPDTRGGRWWDANFSRDVWLPLTVRACMSWPVPYTFRHTMATLLIQAGVPVKVVSERLGHEDVTTTLQTYTHVMQGDQERAAATMEAILGASSAHNKSSADDSD
jgi:integrase